MTSIEFQTPLSERGLTITPDPTTWSISSDDQRELVMTRNTVGGVLLVDSAGYLRTAYAPHLVRVEGTNEPSFIIVNLSEDSLNLAMLEPKAFQSTIVVVPRRSTPTWSIHCDTDLPGDLLQGLDFQGHQRLVAIPNMFLIGQGKEHIEGMFSDNAIKQQVADVHGDEARKWLECVDLAVERHQATRTIVRQIEINSAVSLNTYLGEFAESVIAAVGIPTLSVNILSKRTHQEEYEERRAALGPYVDASPVAAPHQQAVTAGVGAEAVSPTALLQQQQVTFASTLGNTLAARLSTKEDRIEKEQLSRGSNKLLGLFICGDIEVTSGKITSLLKPDMTLAHQELSKKSTKAEKTEDLVRLLDTSNASRGGTSPSVHHRDMSNHDPVAISCLVSGNLSKESLVRIDAKPKAWTSASLLPYELSQVKAMMGELTDAMFRAANDDEVTGTKRDHVAIGLSVGLDQVKSFFANVIAMGEALFVYTNQHKKSFLVLYAE